MCLFVDVISFAQYALILIKAAVTDIGRLIEFEANLFHEVVADFIAFGAG